MTRKKSNVKALALAVTCAILAGGGISLETVYAAPETGVIPMTGNVIYYRTSSELKYGDATYPTDIRELTVGGVTIGGEGVPGGRIIANKIVGGKGLNPSAISINGATFADGGAITATGLKLGTDYDVKEKIDKNIENITTNKNALQALTEDGGRISSLEGRVGTNETNIVALETKTANLSANGKKLTNMEEVGATKLAVGGKEITADTVAGYDAAVSKTANITYDAATKTTYINEGTAQQVVIDEKGLKVGKNTSRMNDITGFATSKNLYVGTTDADNPTAADSKFFVDGATGETVVNGTGGKTTITGGGVTISKAASSEYVSISEGGIFATDSIKATKIISAGLETRMADGKVVAKNGLYVGYSGTDITGATYDNSKFAVDGATGNTAVGGTLSVAGETTFANGIKTDTISENTDGKGVTVDGVVLKDKGISAAGDNFTVDGATGKVTTKGDIQGNNITATGALKGQTLGIGGTDNNQFTVDANGNTNVGGTLDVTGSTTLKDTLNVAGKTTLSDELQVDKTATFGIAAGSQTVINGDNVTTGRIETTTNQASKIGGVTLQSGKITAEGMTINGTIDLENLKVKNELTVGTNTKITEGTLQLGTAEDNKLTAEKLANINQTIKANRVIDATSATIGGVEINGGNVTATGTVQGNTISDGAGATLTSGKITAQEGKIGGAVINETTLNIGDTTLDKANGITTNKLTIGDMALTGTGLNTGTNDFQVNGVTFNQGKVTAQADKGFVAGTSSFKEGSLIVDANNKLEATNGLTTEKATVKGNLDVTGQATFGTVDNQTTINGKTVTTDTLKANRLILGTSGDATVEVDKDGSLIAAKGKFKVDKDGKTTFTKDADNLSSINGGNIWAKATDIADNTSSELTHDYKGLHIKGNKSGQKSAFDFDTSTGIGTFAGQDNSTTKINGSAIRSEKSDGTAGKLDGENLTLYKDANNQTIMSAGKATFTGDAGEKGGKVTTINGGTISTDTLNVERINLGEDILDSNGNPHGSNLSMDKQGNFSAAGGNFKVTGGSGADKGAFTNTVGNTTLQTDNAGASMKFNNTAATDGVTSEVTVEANKATVAAGEKASFVATTDNGGTATITGGTQTVTTTDKGTVFENSAHKTAFVDNGATNTIINGNEITTGKITTDQLVITGKGNADGNGGSIAFGGNGTIKSDINDGTTNGKNTSFETTLDGVNTKVTDGTTTTENKVTAEGNSNIVKQDDTHKSEFNQGLTSIGGVVTNGEIKVAQKLDGATGLLTNEVTDANGSSKLEQSGTGLTYTDSAKPDNATRIDSSDVSIGSKENEKDRINLSDLGQIDNLDHELTGRDEYKNNSTAVGGINAEAAIRREEVARLDGRINDVNDRVNKVGAMAAAIASLKSIGYDPQAPSEFSIGLGQYKGETGVAMGFFHYPNKNFMINVSLSTAGGETMGGIGATWRFGHKSPQKLLEEQREEQAKKELAAAEKYQAAAKLAKEAQERAEYAAKLARQAQVSADNAKAAADATQAKHFG